MNVVVLGGSAAGIVAATTAKSHTPEARVTVIRKEPEALVPCGIPYIFGSLQGSEQDVTPRRKLESAGVDLLIDEVTRVDREARKLVTRRNGEIPYDRLVLATGSTPNVPGWLEGADLAGVYTVPKNKAYIDSLLTGLARVKKVAVIGGGFIGVETSDELNKAGKDVTLVEKLPHVLGAVFDDAPAERVQAILKGRGVNVKSGQGVRKIRGEKEVVSVVLEDGTEMPAEAVILAMGYLPNTGLAEAAGLRLNTFGQIQVDEFMRTDDENIFAVGDCAEKRDFITRRRIPAMLASTACAEARTVGMNLFRLSAVKRFKGTIAVFSTAIGETAFAVAGMTRREADRQNLDVLTADFRAPDKHPAKLPGMHKQEVTLVVERSSGLVLGGSVIGGQSTGELVNVVGLAIQNGMTVYDLLMTQVGTHPLLTAPPTAYPLVRAAQAAVKEMKT